MRPDEQRRWLNRLIDLCIAMDDEGRKSSNYRIIKRPEELATIQPKEQVKITFSCIAKLCRQTLQTASETEQLLQAVQAENQSLRAKLARLALPWYKRLHQNIRKSISKFVTKHISQHEDDIQ